MTLAAHCIANHKPDSLSLLLDNGCPTTNLISIALDFQDGQCFDILLSHDANVNETHPRGGTSLHHCIHGNLVYFASRLLALGVDLSFSDKDGYLAIEKAATNGRREIALLILGRGSPTRALGSSHSAVLSALEYGDLRLAAIVLGAGADPDNWAGSSPLNLAIQRSNDAAVRLLLAVGATRVDQIPLNLQPLFDKWNAKPAATGVKDEVAGLQAELEKAKAVASGFITKAGDPAQFEGQLTPLLGETNKMVVLIAKLATNVELRSRRLRECRQTEIADQMKWLAERERTSVVQTAFLSDEENWRSTISETLRNLSEFEDSLFPGNICTAIRDYLAKLEIKQGKSEEGTEWDRPGKEELERRGRLLYLNRLLNGFRVVVEQVHEFTLRLVECIGKMLDGIERCLKELIDVLVTQQQLNFDFEKVHMQASISSQAAGVLQDRKELLTLDLALVSWERVQFLEISAKIQMLLRYCIV